MALPPTSPLSRPVPKSPPAGPKGNGGEGRATPTKRKRGGQPGNLNARKSGTFSVHRPGPLAAIRAQVRVLNQSQLNGALPPGQITRQARGLSMRLLPMLGTSEHDPVTVSKLAVQLSRLISRVAASTIPAVLQRRALEVIALDPFGFFERGYKEWGISRDADSFFPVSKFSARNSPLSPSHPSLATNLTDEQWAVLAPLIPPDPHGDWLTGEPPVIIAANRWGFTRYSPGSEFNDFVIMQNDRRFLERCPGLGSPSGAASPASKRGRPRKSISPRALLDAILWKLATGHTWNELPLGFPPARLCSKYYRRLFLSGRLYTLLLALFNHLRLDAGIDPAELLQAGVFTATPSQKIALAPGVPAAWHNYTPLLFMQLARTAYTSADREWKRENPFYPLLPVFKGHAPLSTGELAAAPPAQMTFVFEPLETSLAAKKWRKIERDQNTISREVSRRALDLQSDPPYRKMKPGKV